MNAQDAGEFIAERIDVILEALIEHVANHDHSALRPLSHPPEIGVIELSLAPIPSRERIKQDERSVQADPMALCGVGHDAEPFGREVLHGRIDSWRRHVASSDTARPVRTTIRGLREVRAPQNRSAAIGFAVGK